MKRLDGRNQGQLVDWNQSTLYAHFLSIKPGESMTHQFKVGSEVKERDGRQRMFIIGFGQVENDKREHAFCEWRDADGVMRSQQYPVESLVPAVNRGPPGGPLAAARRGSGSRDS